MNDSIFGDRLTVDIGLSHRDLLFQLTSRLLILWLLGRWRSLDLDHRVAFWTCGDGVDD